MKHIFINKKGFTLIELLVVVSVIGILASVILVGVAAFRGKGRDSRRIQDLGQVQNALELYFTKNGAYPPTSDWTTLSNTLIGAGIGVNQVPVEPSSGKSYSYCSSGNRYILGASLEEDNDGARAINNAPCTPAGMVCGPTKGYCLTI